MSTATRSRRSSASVIAMAPIPEVIPDVVPAPIPAPPESPKAPDADPPIVNLANCDKQTQADALVEALQASYREVASAAIATSKGDCEKAAAIFGDGSPVIPTIFLIQRVACLMNNTSPSPLFTDGNNRGVKNGELFATKFGLGASFRKVTKANIKDARDALIEKAR